MTDGTQITLKTGTDRRPVDMMCSGRDVLSKGDGGWLASWDISHALKVLARLSVADYANILTDFEEPLVVVPRVPGEM